MSRQRAIATSAGSLALRERLPADQHPAKVYIARLGPGSRRTMRGALNTIAGILTGEQADAETLAWSRVRYQHTAAVRSALAERYSPATANKMLAALRGVLRECWRLGLMGVEDYQRAADLANVKGEKELRGRALTLGEVATLFQACADDSTPAGARDAAVIAILYGAGLRRSELSALDFDDYDPETGALTIRSGKGNRDRTVYVANGSEDAVKAWLGHRGDEPGPLFCPITKSGSLLRGQRLGGSRAAEAPDRSGSLPTGHAVYELLRKRAKEAGVREFSPHDLRRTFVSHLLTRGADLSTVQRLAGHAQIQTTARYDKRGEEAKRKASELLLVPYVGPEEGERK